MNRKISKLYLEKKQKRLTGRAISKGTGISESAISQYFSGDLKLSENRELKLIDYIDNYI